MATCLTTHVIAPSTCIAIVSDSELSQTESTLGLALALRIFWRPTAAASLAVDTHEKECDISENPAAHEVRELVLLWQRCGVLLVRALLEVLEVVGPAARAASAR